MAGQRPGPGLGNAADGAVETLGKAIQLAGNLLRQGALFGAGGCGQLGMESADFAVDGALVAVNRQNGLKNSANKK